MVHLSRPPPGAARVSRKVARLEAQEGKAGEGDVPGEAVALGETGRRRIEGRCGMWGNGRSWGRPAMGLNRRRSCWSRERIRLVGVQGRQRDGGSTPSRRQREGWWSCVGEEEGWSTGGGGVEEGDRRWRRECGLGERVFIFFFSLT